MQPTRKSMVHGGQLPRPYRGWALISGSLLVILGWALAGCSTSGPRWWSDADRAASIQPYADRLLQGESPDRFLRRRTGIVVSGDFVAVTGQAGTQSGSLEFVLHPNRTLRTGLAVAVAPDGYFLTAAHCVEEPGNFLFYPQPGGVGVEVPRIVARIRDRSTHLDLALLHVEARLAAVLNLAGHDAFAPGQLVWAVGASTPVPHDPQRASLGLVSLAGRVRKIESLPDGTRALHSDLLERAGDSGGPVVSEAGGLLGVHTGSWSGTGRVADAIAFQPPRGWLEAQLRADRAAPARPRPDSAPSAIGRSDAIRLEIALE